MPKEIARLVIMLFVLASFSFLTPTTFAQDETPNSVDAVNVTYGGSPNPYLVGESGYMLITDNPFRASSDYEIAFTLNTHLTSGAYTATLNGDSVACTGSETITCFYGDVVQSDKIMFRQDFTVKQQIGEFVNNSSVSWISDLGPGRQDIGFIVQVVSIQIDSPVVKNWEEGLYDPTWDWGINLTGPFDGNDFPIKVNFLTSCNGHGDNHNGKFAWTLDVPGWNKLGNGVYREWVQETLVPIKWTMSTPWKTFEGEIVGPKCYDELPLPTQEIFLPNTTMTLGTQATLPILVSNTTGKNIFSYQFVVRYEPNTFDVVEYAFETAVRNTISQGFTGKIDYSEIGVVKVAAFGTSPLEGDGALIKLNFRPKAINVISMMLEQVMFNAGSPMAVAESGTMTVDPISITGHIWYAIPNQNPVWGVRLDANGSTSDWTRTDGNGFFNHTIMQTGQYSVLPSDAGNIEYITKITAEDAGAILGLVFQEVSGNMLRVADVDEDGKVTAFDAALVARKVVGLTDIPSLVGKWIFDPEIRTLNVQQSIEGQDFVAFAKGDLTALEHEVRSSVKSRVTFEGEIGGIRLQITGQLARGYTANFSFDSNCAFVSPFESNGMSSVFNDTTPGKVQIAVFGATASELNLFTNFDVTNNCEVALESVQIGNEPQMMVNKTVILFPIVATKQIFLPAVSR